MALPASGAIELTYDAFGAMGPTIGVQNAGSSTVTVRGSSITARFDPAAAEPQHDDVAIGNTQAGSAKVADTMLDGSVTVGGGLTCFSVFDPDFEPFDCARPEP